MADPSISTADLMNSFIGMTKSLPSTAVCEALLAAAFYKARTMPLEDRQRVAENAIRIGEELACPTPQAEFRHGR